MRFSIVLPDPAARAAGGRLARALLAAAPLLAACDLDSVLEVDDPFTVTPETARDTANLANTFAGARAQFAFAVGGQQNNEGGIVMTAGLMADELYAADNFTSRWEVDSRQIDYSGISASSDFAYIYLQRARAAALNAAEIFAGSSQAGSPRHAELYNLVGYSVLMLAENFCSGVPLSELKLSGEFTYGEPLTTAQLYEQAIAYFDQAAATAGSNARQKNLATLAKARTLLDRGRFADAAAAAATVPDNFAPYLVEYDPVVDGTWNAIFQLSNGERRFSVSVSEGTQNRGLPFGQDPRTPIDPTPVGSVFGSGVVVHLQQKYPGYGADIPIATAHEARYIQAEAALRGGNVAEFERLLNAARALQGLPALTSAQIGAGTDARVDTLFRERAYALWLTGHRLSDLRRLIRQYGRREDQVFPTGATAIGIEYGTAVSLPVPFDEVNNPNFGGCLSTDA